MQRFIGNLGVNVHRHLNAGMSQYRLKMLWRNDIALNGAVCEAASQRVRRQMWKQQRRAIFLFVVGGCEKVATESTASYWKPLYNILESTGLSAMVVNAQHMKAVPSRKTDMTDAEWIADLLRHGLLKASYIPDKAQRELREMVGYRKNLIKEQAAELNCLQKILETVPKDINENVQNQNGIQPDFTKPMNFP